MTPLTGQPAELSRRLIFKLSYDASASEVGLCPGPILTLPCFRALMAR